VTRKRRAVLSYDPDLIDRWRAAQAAWRLALDAIQEHRAQLRRLTVPELHKFFCKHPEFRDEGKRLDAVEKQARSQYLRTERALRSFERKAMHQRAQSPALKIFEPDSEEFKEFEAKIAFEVRDFCELWELPQDLYAQDLIQDATVFLLGRLPDYSPGDASILTWIFAKPRGLLYGFLHNLTRDDKALAWKTPSGDEHTGISDEETGEPLTVREAAENDQARMQATNQFDPEENEDLAQNLIRALIDTCEITKRDASVWSYRYRLDNPYARKPKDFQAVAERFGLSEPNARKIVSRTNVLIKSELGRLGLREPSQRHLDPGKFEPPMNEEYRHQEWERQRDDSWREFRGKYENHKKDAA
jgi:hypothetical protein